MSAPTCVLSSFPSPGFNIGVVREPQIGRANLGLVSAEGALKPPPGDPRCCFCCCFEAPNTEFSEQFPGIPLGLARATAEERRCFTIFTLRYCSQYFRKGGGRGGLSEAVKPVMTGDVKAYVNAGILHKSTQTKERFSF